MPLNIGFFDSPKQRPNRRARRAKQRERDARSRHATEDWARRSKPPLPWKTTETTESEED